MMNISDFCGSFVRQIKLNLFGKLEGLQRVRYRSHSFPFEPQGGTRHPAMGVHGPNKDPEGEGCLTY